jgi:hypothetical protein
MRAVGLPACLQERATGAAEGLSRPHPHLKGTPRARSGNSSKAQAGRQANSKINIKVKVKKAQAGARPSGVEQSPPQPETRQARAFSS